MKISPSNRRLAILGVILLGCIGALIGRPDTLLLVIGGLLALIKDDGDENGLH